MKIIDFERKGNVVRFYLGEKTVDWGWTNPDYKDSEGKTPDWLKPSNTYYGDDWDDAPYEHNAGPVYEEFVKGYHDFVFSFDDLVLEPADDDLNSSYNKEDMTNRKVPCIVVVPSEVIQKLDSPYEWAISFEDATKMKESKKFYFEDELVE